MAHGCDGVQTSPLAGPTENFRWLIAVFLAGFLMAVPLCLDAAEPAPPPPPEYTLGVFPFLAQPTLESIFAPITGELSAAIGRPIRYQSAASFEKFMVSLEAGQYDIAHIHPFDFVRIALKAGYLPLATRNELLAVVFVVEENSAIRQPADLRGKHIGLPPKEAASTYLARIALDEAGLKPGNDVILQNFTTHQSCLQQLLIGNIDVCACGRPVARLFASQTGRPLRSVLTSPEIFSTLFVVHQRVPAAERDILQKTLLATRLQDIAPELRKLFVQPDAEGAAYFRTVDVKEFDSVRRYIEILDRQEQQ